MRKPGLACGVLLAWQILPALAQAQGAPPAAAPAPARQGAPTPGYSVPVVDLAAEPSYQVVVDRESGQYLGHPTTVLLEDGRTIVAVYPKGHGRGAIVLKRSKDGGRTVKAP